MASITVQAQRVPSGPLRPLNVLHDLPQVADLIELCFASTIDDEGQSYLDQMRRASRDNDFLRWAARVVDTTSMPLSGFVWEENGRVVGNVSLVYQTYASRKIAMIANVATHPDFRRRGIGRTLTEGAMNHARRKGAKELWLHVRDDNPTAIRIYQELGFRERARRTTYNSKPGSPVPSLFGQPSPTVESRPRVIVTQPRGRDWPTQRLWLNRAHPRELSWYSRWNWDRLSPNLWSWLYRNLVEFNIRQWAALHDGKLLATVSWVPGIHTSNMLWIGAEPYGDAEGVRAALETARYDLSHYRRLTVEHPAGEMVDAIRSAGFDIFRTLIWMRADAT
ncbi:MAG TPA: GNAT family N-acetyltransferase [Anaerolineales bacterium]